MSSTVSRIAVQAARSVRRTVGVFTAIEARRFLESVFAEVARELQEQGTVTIPSFGKFTVRVRKARATRHPKTREPVALPANVEVRFSASGMLTERLSNWLARAP